MWFAYPGKTQKDISKRSRFVVPDELIKHVGHFLVTKTKGVLLRPFVLWPQCG